MAFQKHLRSVTYEVCYRVLFTSKGVDLEPNSSKATSKGIHSGFNVFYNNIMGFENQSMLRNLST